MAMAMAMAMTPPSLLVIILLLFSLQTNSQHNLSFQRTILLRLRQQWRYYTSSHLTSWNSTPSPCNWPSVSCTNDMVTGLALSQQYTVGRLPSSICELKHLVWIDLSYNFLLGNIPACLRNCSNLQHLDLSGNQLSGTIPGQLFLMESLVNLSLSGNGLDGNIPMTIEMAKNLLRLDLSFNHLNGSIPGGIAYPYNLSYLDLSHNEFSGEIPERLFLLESLATLSLRGNRLYGNIPTTIEKASSLEWLHLSNNNLNGSIPGGIAYPQNLSYLDLSTNEFSGEIPGALFLMKSLVSLSLGRNRLQGNLPTTIENSRSLEKLDLSNNNLNGSILDSITYLYNLSHLDLSRNSFSGEIPTRLLRTRRLQYLSLGYNNLSGQLPSYIDLGILQLLNLTHNRLRGPIPIRTVTPSGSRSCYLDLSNNQLSGEVGYIILNGILDLMLVAGINICNNEFSGMVPDLVVDEFFPNECLDPSKICYVESTNKSLPSCPSSWSSHYKFHGYKICHRRSHSIIIIALGIAAGWGLGFLVLYYLTRKCILLLQSDPSMKEEDEWRMISFPGLEFEKTDILSGLTEENLIGNGGSGKVYRVLIEQTRSYVAVKSISISKISDHRAEKEFLAEIQALGAVWHYNIIKLLCYISGPDLKLLVYEYFENKSLDRWLHGNASVTKLDWPTRLNIAIGAAQGLCYMHHHCPIPIIHRDIKSSNILLDSDFNAKIADFGLAKLPNTFGDTETASVVAGTFGYIAPEYAYTSKVNTKSDVYSFGVVLLELTTGRKAVTRGDHLNLGGWAHLQCKDTAATIDALDDDIKEATMYLDEVISVFRLGVVCTAALPTRRPSMKDCLQILMKCSNKCSSSGAAA